jgi:hypothetical protein
MRTGSALRRQAGIRKVGCARSGRGRGWDRQHDAGESTREWRSLPSYSNPQTGFLREARARAGVAPWRRDAPALAYRTPRFAGGHEVGRSRLASAPRLAASERLLLPLITPGGHRAGAGEGLAADKYVNAGGPTPGLRGRLSFTTDASFEEGSLRQRAAQRLGAAEQSAFGAQRVPHPRVGLNQLGRQNCMAR